MANLTTLFVAVAVVAVLAARATAQSGCTAALMSLAPCLPFLRNRAVSPSLDCCSRFTTVLQSNGACICAVASGASLPLGIKVNHTQSLALPNACNVTTPSGCNGTSTSPASPPASTPASPSVGSLPPASPPSLMPPSPSLPTERPPTSQHTTTHPGTDTKPVAQPGKSSASSTTSLTSTLAVAAAYATIALL